MKFHEKISEQQKKKLETIRRKNEQLTARDIEELMGTRRETYKRNRGAIRRK